MPVPELGEAAKARKARRKAARRSRLSASRAEGQGLPIPRPTTNAVLTTVVDAWGRSWTSRCPIKPSGLLRWIVVDSCGPGRSPEKRKADRSTAVSVRTRPGCPRLSARPHRRVRIALPNLAVFDQAAPLRGAGSGAPRAGLCLGRPARRARAVPAVPGHRSQAACPARRIGASAGLLRRIRAFPPRPSCPAHASRVDARSALAWLARRASGHRTGAAPAAGVDVPGLVHQDEQEAGRWSQPWRSSASYGMTGHPAPRT